jgi:hypothetical protein
MIDIFEMTWRSGSDFSTMPFPEFKNYKLKFEGKMEHGYKVYSFQWKDTFIYGVKIENEFVSFCQVKPLIIPKLGEVLETMASKTEQEFSNKLLSYKLRFFMVKHLGKSIVLGNVHSVATENILSKISYLFTMKMVNIKTGECLDWTKEEYENLTSKNEPTEWQVLLEGLDRHFSKNESLDWDKENRHLWTYGSYFENL